MSGGEEKRSYCLNKDDAMQVIDGAPRTTYSQSDIRGCLLEESGIEVIL